MNLIDQEASMSKHVQRCVLVALLLWGGTATGSALALGPVDGGELPSTDLERVQVSILAPDFTLEDEKGTPITLSQFRGEKNVILVFYRGRW
jgi:cytochrome oxidase Cu insertion factor (SCO1/SenC/PrrC family)